MKYQPAAPKRWRKGCKNRQRTTDCGKIIANGGEFGRHIVSTSSSSVNSPIESRSLGYSKHPVDRLDVQDTARRNKKFQSRRSVEFSRWQKDAPLDGGTGKLHAPGYQGYPGNPRTRGSSEDSGTATAFLCITRLCIST